MSERWPGWDGWLVVGCGIAVLAFAAARGADGLGHWIGLVVGLDAAWLAATWWSRS